MGRKSVTKGKTLLKPAEKGRPRSSLQDAISTGNPQKLQRSLDKRCDQLEKLSANKRLAASKMFQWKKKRMTDEVRIILQAMLKTEHGQSLADSEPMSERSSSK